MYAWSQSLTRLPATSSTPPLQVAKEYGEGRMLTSEVKALLVGVLVPMVVAHQEARRGVTDDIVKLFMTPRPLDFASAAEHVRKAAA